MLTNVACVAGSIDGERNKVLASPQAKRNLYKGRSTTKKSLNFSESTPSNATNKENMPWMSTKCPLGNIRGII